MNGKLIAAYYNLYDLWWNETSTVEINVAGYSGISCEDISKLDEAAERIEFLIMTDQDQA